MGRRAMKKVEEEAGKPAAFYAKAFSPQELKALEAEAAEGLEGEIRMLRVVMRRVMTLASGAETLEEAQKAMAALGLAATRLAGLLKVHEALGGETESMRLIDQAVSAVAEELGIDREAPEDEFEAEKDNEFGNELDDEADETPSPRPSP